jgi:hypothetical protein
MTKAQIRKAVTCAAERVEREIAASTNQKDKYSRGLSYEGYAGGYLAALRDVQLVINGVLPSTRGYLVPK